MTTRGQFVLSTENPLDKYTDDTPWGTVLYQKFKSGLGILQTNLLQLGKLVAEGQSETEKFVNKTFFPKMEENLIKLQEAYGKNPDANWVLEGLEGLIDSSVKMQQTASAAGEAKDPLKKFIGTGVEAIAPVGGAMFMAGAVTPMSKLAQAKIGGAKVAEFWNSTRKLFPFAATAGAQTTSQLEQTNPDIPYLNKIAAGVLTGAGEAATELPVYMGITRLLKKPGKVLVNKGAQAIFKSSKLIKWLWSGLGQIAQEVEMEPISMSVLQAVGVEQDWSKLPQNMIQAAYDGSAMVVTLAGIGGMSARAQKLVLNKIEKDNPTIPEAIKMIKEVSKALPPKVEPLAPKPVELYREQAEVSRKEVIRLEERLETAPKSMEEGLLYDITLQKQRAEMYEQKVIDKGTLAPDTVSGEAIEVTFTGEEIDEADFSSQPLENILDLLDIGQELGEEGTGEYEMPEDVTAEGFDVESVGTEWEANIGQLQEQVGTGETATRGAALSIEEKAVANKVIEGFDNLPTYEKVTAENQIKNGTRILQDPARAERIAMGEEVCPADTLPEIVMKLVEEKATQEGNDELIWELAHNSKLLAEETTMGQRIWALSLRDVFSPVKTIRGLLKTQEKAYTERGKGDYKKDKQKEVKDIEKKIEKTKGTPNKVTEAIDRGELDPEELAGKSSQARRKIFEPLVGEKKAQEVNADFESKLPLKNQQKGLEDWADNIKNKKVKKDILDKIKKMDKLLNQKNMQKFLEDLIARKLGVGVTMEQAKQVSKLSKTAYDAKKVMEASPRRGHLEKATETELNYGKARVLFRNYVDNLKEHAQKLTLAERLKPYNWWDTIKMIAGIAKSAKSTFDNSGLLRQGLKNFWDNPKIWFKNANQSWRDIVDVLGNKKVQDMIDADAFSRPNFDEYIKQELAINVTEEEFPYSDVLEKIPILGKVHLAAETAFTGLAKRNRMDFFDYYYKIAQEQGHYPKGLGRMVNSQTGRGHLGAWEGAADAINVMFFSMRFFKSNVDFLTAHAFDSKVDAWTKKRAARSLLKTVIGTAAVLAMAKALVPDSVEEDRTSANYGKIKIGNTRFDVTGGMGSLITLASRLIPIAWGEGKMKSSTTGIITKLNADTFNARTGMDLFYNFFENKLSPAAGFVRDLGKGRNFQGEKPTPLTQLRDLFVPIIIQEYSELKSDPHSADILLALIAEGIGIGINTYSAEVDWDYKQGKILKQFKEKVGDTKYYEANRKFNKEWLEWFNEIVKHPKYRAMSEEDKQKTITSRKAEIKAKIFRKYRFKYKQGE